MYRKNHTKHEAPHETTDEHGKKIRNPNKITVDQHVTPRKHLAEWAGSSGRISIIDIETGESIQPRPDDAFVVSRLWDQPMEAGTVKSTEDKFQEEIARLRASNKISHHQLITEYFVMLGARACCAAMPRPDYKSTMHSPNLTPTKEELELDELAQVNDSVRFIRGFNGQSTSRLVVSMTMNSIFLRYRTDLKDRQWIPFESLGEKFILPDSLWFLLQHDFLLLPVSPDLILIESRIYEQLSDRGLLNAEALNTFLKQSVRQHFVEAPKEP